MAIKIWIYSTAINYKSTPFLEAVIRKDADIPVELVRTEDGQGLVGHVNRHEKRAGHKGRPHFHAVG